MKNRLFSCRFLVYCVCVVKLVLSVVKQHSDLKMSDSEDTENVELDTLI